MHIDTSIVQPSWEGPITARPCAPPFTAKRSNARSTWPSTPFLRIVRCHKLSGVQYMSNNVLHASSYVCFCVCVYEHPPHAYKVIYHLYLSVHLSAYFYVSLSLHVCFESSLICFAFFTQFLSACLWISVCPFAYLYVSLHEYIISFFLFFMSSVFSIL